MKAVWIGAYLAVVEWDDTAKINHETNGFRRD